MKSTGEVMGVGKTFGEAFVKSQLGAGVKLPTSGKVFLSVKGSDKPRAVQVAKDLVALGFSIVATKGTAAAISAAGIPVTTVNKVVEGRPHIVDMVKNNEISLVVNTVEEKAYRDCRFGRDPYFRTGSTGDNLHHDCRRRGCGRRYAPSGCVGCV